MATSTVQSNALNFRSALQSAVDPRTGQYKVNISLPQLNGNNLNGPAFSPTLTYSPLTKENTGFGLGWAFQLSQYDAHTQVLSLSSGETFKVTGVTGNRLEMQEQKIKSFIFMDLGSSRLQVVHKSGMVEILRQVGRLALPETIYSPEGYKINLAYQFYGDGLRCLHTVTDGQGEVLLQINLPTPGRKEIELLLRPDGNPGGALARYVMKLRDSGPGDEVYEFVLPSDEQASWRFNYRTEKGLHCITDVWTPVGGHETIEYAGNGHGFPGDARAALPRVFRVRIDPGFGQLVQEVRYSYTNSSLPDDGHNFLGNGANISWKENGLDNLYQILERYLYGTTETHYADGMAVRTIERTFNRYHLLTLEKTSQENKVHQVFYTYYADDNLDLPFSSQSPQCQLLKNVETRWSVGSASRSENQLTRYDTHGNLTEQVHANGVKETYSYFPIDGVPGECPPDPAGFVRSLREKTVTPAPGQQAGAPVLSTLHRYALMPSLKGESLDPSNDWLVLTHEDLFEIDGSQPVPLQQLTYRTINQPDNSLLHGRREQVALTLNGLTTTTDYAYEKLDSAFVGEAVLRTTRTLTGYDHGVDGKHTRKITIDEHSLRHGELVLTQDDNNVRIRYVYDALLQVLSEIVAPGNALYEATRTYTYALVNDKGQQASQIAIDVKGVGVRTLLDGQGRVILEQRADTDNRDGGHAEQLRETYVAHYNALGQLKEEIERDWCSAEPDEDLVLTTCYFYDDWGEQCSVLRPDGVLEYEFTDPIKLLTTRWTEGMGKTVTLSNLFDTPVWIKRYAKDADPSDPNVEPLSEHHYKCDGLGRTTEETNAMGRTTRYAYDPFNRMTRTTLPDEVAVERHYALHSTDELPIAIQVASAEAGQDPIELGTQTFDGLGRSTRLTVGPRTETYEYSGSQSQVSTRTTPAGQPIHYFHVLELTAQPTRIETIEDKQSQFTYDPKSAYLGSSSNSQSQQEFDYDSAGNVKEHRWTVDGNTWTNHYRHSLSGRQLIRKDVGDIDCQYLYEQSTGRLHTLSQGNIQATFEYDDLGRLLRITSRDLSAGTRLTTEIGYDDLGRETLRTLTPGDQPARRLSQAWQADDRLLSRHLQAEDGRSLLLETFGYDQRGRLELHTCSGDELPRDCHGNEIIQQLFVFDALDNITECRTRFKDGSQDLAEFSYSRDDVCQLHKVTHSHPSYSPQSVEFRFDANGNMLNDEQGRNLDYDSQGRLVTVRDSHGVVLAGYRYDPHNHLFGVTTAGQQETLRFYQNDRLSDTVQGPTHTQYLTSLGQPLAQQQPDDTGQTLLLMTDGKRSVIGETQQSTLRTEVYSGYGERDANSTMKSRLAFNGEVYEDITQWYLLGRGYRAYNPCLMRFHSPDSFSPFGAGGINPYMYCAGDPINFSDPTGHFISFGEAGLDQAIFAIAGIFFGLITQNSIAIIAGFTQLSAAAGMMSADSTDSQKAMNARIAGFAQMIEIGSALGKYAFKKLTTGTTINRFTHNTITNNTYNTFNMPRRNSAPAIMKTPASRKSSLADSGPKISRRKSMGDTSTNTFSRGTVEAGTGTTPRNSVVDASTGTSPANNPPTSTQTPLALDDVQNQQFNTIEAPTFDTVNTTTTIETTEVVYRARDNAYMRPGTGNKPFNNKGGTLHIKKPQQPQG